MNEPLSRWDWNSSRSESPNMANAKHLPLLGNALRANPTYELSLRNFSHSLPNFPPLLSSP